MTITTKLRVVVVRYPVFSVYRHDTAAKNKGTSGFVKEISLSELRSV